MDAHDDEQQAAAERLIQRWSSSGSMLFDGEHRAEAERYLRAVDELRQVDSAMLELAMSRLEKEFSYILVSRVNDLDEDFLARDFSSMSFGGNSFSNHGEGGDFQEEDAADEDPRFFGVSKTIGSSSIPSRIWEIDLFPSDAMLDLQSIAEKMSAGGYRSECFQAYTRGRTATLDHYLRRLGVERLGDAQSLSWETAENMIRRWIRAAASAIRVLFSSERRLCELIFSGGIADDDWTEIFEDIVKNAALQLLNFPDAICEVQRGPETIFKFIDLHDAITKLLPDVETVFGCTSAVYSYAVDILSRLAHMIRGIFSDFVAALLRERERERSKTPVPGGKLHPMIRYVMNYINVIAEYAQSLSEIIVSPPPCRETLAGAPELDFRALQVETPLEMYLVLIIAITCSNLEGVAELYKEPGLSHVFLLNNIHYIVHKVKDSVELRKLIKPEYLRELMSKYQREATNYQRAVWFNVLHLLRDEGIQSQAGASRGGVSTRVLRERFKAFNSAFEELHRLQQAWIVPDAQLKDELRIQITVRLLPAYRSFLTRYSKYIESGRHPEQYIRYTEEQLELMLGDFFEGLQPPPSSHFSRWMSL